MANNNPVYLKKFALSTLDAMISYKHDFRSAVKDKNSDDIANLIHKSTMTLFYIEANTLTSLLNECRELIAKENDTLLKEKEKDCVAEFDFIIKELESVY